MRFLSAFSIALGILALAACAQQGHDRQEAVPTGAFPFTGAGSSATDNNDDGPCPEAAFPGSAPLEGSERDGAMAFFCEH
jgi:hypothetical protein